MESISIEQIKQRAIELNASVEVIKPITLSENKIVRIKLLDRENKEVLETYEIEDNGTSIGNYFEYLMSK